MDEAALAEERAATQVLALDRHLIELAEVFQGGSVPFRVLKGPAHAQSLWARGDLRFYGDIDVAVPGRSFDRAAALIEGHLSGRRHRPDPREGFTARVGKGSTFTLPDGVEVDLHRTLADGPFGASILSDDLFEGSGVVLVGGRGLPTLTRPMMFIHACLHAVTAEKVRSLIPHRDVAEGLEALEVGERAEVLERSASWRCQIVVAQAIRSARARFGMQRAPTAAADLVAWAQTYEPSPLERMWVGASTGSFPGRALAETACMVPALRSWSDRALYVRGVVGNDHRPPWRRRVARLGRR